MTKKKEFICSQCNSKSVVTRDFDDSISRHGKHIKEREIECNECHFRKTIEIE